MNEMPGIMSHMPPLPVSINEDLFNSILPSASQVSCHLLPKLLFSMVSRRNCVIYIAALLTN